MPVPPNDQQIDWRSFKIEQSGASDGLCECCGSFTKRAWGLVHRNSGEAVAAYFVGWVQHRPDHGATFDLILGKWDASATKDDRYAIALDYQMAEGSPQFMVIDAVRRLAVYAELATSALQRSEVIGTPLAPQVFALIDAIYMGDSRLDELRTWK